MEGGKGYHGRRKRGRSQLISALGLGSPRLCTIFQLGVVCPVFSIIMLESLYLFQSSLYPDFLFAYSEP